MPSKLLRKIITSYRDLSLQNVITLPFLLQIFITIGLVGYFSWRNGEQAVNNVTSQLRSEVTAGVEKHLENYLKTPHLIVQLKQNSVRTGQLDINDFSTIQQDFWSTIQLFDSVRAIYLGDEIGKFIYTKSEAGKFYSQEVTKTPERKIYLLDSFGQKQKLIEVDQYNPRERPWYINTKKIQGNNWSRVYNFTGGELGITAAGLLQDNQGNIQGIVGVDLILSGIDRFLQNLKISKNGQVFILERNGYLIATSTDEPPFTFDAATKTEKRLRAIDSENSLVRATTEHITDYFHSLYNVDSLKQLEFKLKASNQLVQVVPYQDKFGLDWLIVVVLPEADFMGEIEANNRNTIWLCLLALALATILGIYTSRRIAQPIANLSQVTKMVAQSARAKNASTNFYPVVKAKSIKELKLLAESFNEMVIQLKEAFKSLENSNKTLEKRVEQRTEALMIAKEAADAANHAKSEFLANMSHELRTPLHAILGFTQVALQDASLKPQQQENLLTVKRSGEHLLSLINDVLEMSKIEAGSLSVDAKPFDLHLLLDNLGKMFKLRLSSQKHIKLTFNLAPELPQYIETDPVKLNQILINLIENGIKFTDKGGVTLIVKPVMSGSFKQLNVMADEETGRRGDGENFYLKLSDELNITESNSKAIAIAFTVKDTGHGILPSELESIFIPFIQTKQSNQEGTGLGLAICQQFVRLLGGEIKVNSILGQGSTFEFQIPIKIIEHKNIASAQQPLNKLDSVPEKTYQPLSTPTKAITKSDLVNMQTQWLKKLHEAAIAIDSDLILQLIAQIPSINQDLIQGLTRMVKNFEYDEIVELVEQELERRKN
jgi:signal transduction histidine kinase